MFKLAKTPTMMTREDIQALRAVGFDDQGVVGVAHMACHFNYFNHIALSLGCELHLDE